MREPQGAVWVLSTGLEYEGSHALAAFPDPEAASAYLESLGVRLRGHYEDIPGKRLHWLVPGWDTSTPGHWLTEIGDDDGYGDYALIRQVPWNPTPVAKGERDG